MAQESDMSINELYELLKRSQDKQTEKLTKEITKNREEFNRKIKNTDKAIKRLENQHLFLARKQRKNNLVIFGLKVAADKILEECIVFLNQKLSINIEQRDINNIYHIGREESKKGILIEFVSYLTKQEIFRNVFKLKGTKISIVNDLSPEDRETQKILIKHLKIARSENKVARIKGLSVEIDGQLYSAQELEKTEYESEYYTDTEAEEFEDEEEDQEIQKDEGSKETRITKSGKKEKSGAKKRKLGKPLKQTRTQVNTRLAAKDQSVK